MRLALFACVLTVAGCGKKDAAKTDDNGSGAAAHKGSGQATGSGEGADTPAPGPGITVAHSVPEFTGTYDKAFGKLANADEPTTIAFGRCKETDIVKAITSTPRDGSDKPNTPVVIKKLTIGKG